MFSKPGIFPACGMFNITHYIAMVICFTLVIVGVILSKKITKEKMNKVVIIVDSTCDLPKDLIEKNEDKDDKFNREDLYKYFGANTDTQLKWNDLDKAIELLKKKLESD